MLRPFARGCSCTSTLDSDPLTASSPSSTYYNSNMTPRSSPTLLGQKLQFFHDSVVSQFPEETRAQRKPNQNNIEK